MTMFVIVLLMMDKDKACIDKFYRPQHVLFSGSLLGHYAASEGLIGSFMLDLAAASA